jgi:uncharacterized YigZ family protein
MFILIKVPQAIHTRTCFRVFSVASQMKLTLVGSCTHSETIKKSVFVVHAGRANTFDDAKAFLNNVRDDSATHNCWAYNSERVQRSSDDGEPAGTAGRPMLQALLSENVVNVIVVVIRYYGGIKLGTGGLSRAYGGSVQTALRNATKMEFIPTTVIRIQTLHKDSHTVYSLLKPFQIVNVTQCCDSPEESIDGTSDEISDGVFLSDLNLLRTSLTVEVPTNEVETLRIRFRDTLQGRGSFVVE